MVKKNAYKWLCFVIVLSLISVFTSCVSVKKRNLAGAYIDSVSTIKIDKFPFDYQIPVIQPYEFVEVRFAGLNPNVSKTLNNYGGESQATQISDLGGGFSGQQVDKDGNLNFPLIGKVRAVGLTTDMLKAELMNRVDSILMEPYIYVGLPRRGVTFLGEVRTSGPIVFSKERANILEFLARAGNVTDFADITKVKVYRDGPDGRRILGNINLNDTALFKSPFFYPNPNDVVYVPSSKRKSIQSGNMIFPYISLLVSIISLTLAYTRR
jgi:polysaccharide export outer membrane protein